MKLKIKVGDEVQVIAGGDKGKKGSVLKVLPLKQQIKVKDVRVQTKFDKEKGIQKIEGLIDYSNVKLIKAREPKAYKKSKKDSKKGLLKK